MTSVQPGVKEAVERVSRYLARLSKSRQHDQESIHAFDMGEPSEAILGPADLRTLLAALSSQADRAELLIDALVQADLTIRSKPGADQSHVEFIRTTLSQYRSLNGDA